MDTSGSVGRPYSRDRWFRHQLSYPILPTFLSRIPYFSDHKVELAIFGAKVHSLGKSTLDQVVIAPILDQEALENTEPENTSLKAALDHAVKGGYSSVWLYTDAIDTAPDKDNRIAEILRKRREEDEKRSRSKVSAAPPTKRLYLQLAPVYAGPDDTQEVYEGRKAKQPEYVKQLTKYANQRGFKVIPITQTPPDQALAQCEDWIMTIPSDPGVY
jgi:hypothetical protein